MTGLIYVILIALWGVVLVPRWLRHHDESKRRKEAERVERALNPHRLAPVDDRDHSDEHFQSWREYLRSLSRLDTQRWESAAWLTQLRTPQGPHARRRRNITFGLAGAATVGLVGATIGIVPGFVAVLLILALAGYVSLMFLQMRQWQQGAAPATVADRYDVAPMRSSEYAPARDGVRLVQPDSTAGTDTGWAPQQTPAPIYASKAKASKIPRRIDLTHGQGWTGADMVEQARAQQFDREFAVVEPDVEAEVEELANYRDSERYYRRAVNE